VLGGEVKSHLSSWQMAFGLSVNTVANTSQTKLVHKSYSEEGYEPVKLFTFQAQHPLIQKLIESIKCPAKITNYFLRNAL
jgi:hypothetical protein